MRHQEGNCWWKPRLEKGKAGKGESKGASKGGGKQKAKSKGEGSHTLGEEEQRWPEEGKGDPTGVDSLFGLDHPWETASEAGDNNDCFHTLSLSEDSLDEDDEVEDDQPVSEEAMDEDDPPDWGNRGGESDEEADASSEEDEEQDAEPAASSVGEHRVAACIAGEEVPRVRFGEILSEGIFYEQASRKTCDEFTEGSHRTLKAELTSAEGAKARDLKKNGAAEEAKAAKNTLQELKACERKGSVRLRSDIRAGHPRTMCNLKEESRQRVADFERAPWRAQKAKERLEQDELWHEAFDKEGAGSYSMNPRAPDAQ